MNGKILNYHNAFTLAEMMIVLLIASIVLACMAPAITTKIKADQSSHLTSPWKWTQNGIDAYFGINDSQVAMIGQREKNLTDNARLIINSNDTNPVHILLKHNNTILGNVQMNTNGGVLLGSLTSGESIANNSIAIGRNVSATKENSVVIGDGARGASAAYGGGSIAIGPAANAIEFDSIAIGRNARTLDDWAQGGSIAIGLDAYAEAYWTIRPGIAIGNLAHNLNSGGISIGYNAESVLNSIAIGHETITNRYDAIAIGAEAHAYGGDAIALGSKATSGALKEDGTPSTSQSIAIGKNSEATGHLSTAMGYKSVASKTYTIATGYMANATEARAVAFGPGANATNENSTAIGSETRASGRSAVALGHKAKGYGNNTIAIGTAALSGALSDESETIASYTLAIGYASESIEERAIAIGVTSRAHGKRSIAIGEIATASTDNSIAIGSGATVSGENSVAIGRNVTASNKNSIVLGTNAYNVSIPGTLTVQGTAYPSDRRLKNVGKENLDGLAKLRKIKVFNYTFKKDETKTPRVGVIAQDLQKIFPNAVKKGADGFLTIRMEDMFYAVINAIKELDLKYQAQEKRIQSLEKDNSDLRIRLEKLEAKIR